MSTKSRLSTAAIYRRTPLFTFQQLEVFSAMPDYPNYLAVVMVMPAVAPNARAVAGLTLKNYVKSHELAPISLQAVRQASLQAVVDSQERVRVAAGSVLSAILMNNPDAWPESLEILLQFVDRQEPHAVEVRMFVEIKIVSLRLR